MLLLAVGGFGVPVASSAQENDRAALVARDTATGGAHWTTTTNGTRSASLGTWHSVTTDGDGRVTRLSLEDSNLTGATPPALGTVTTLRNQEDLTDEQCEALSHALGMSVEDIRALGLSPDELPLARQLPAGPAHLVVTPRDNGWKQAIRRARRSQEKLGGKFAHNSSSLFL